MPPPAASPDHTETIGIHKARKVAGKVPEEWPAVSRRNRNYIQDGEGAALGVYGVSRGG